MGFCCACCVGGVVAGDELPMSCWVLCVGKGTARYEGGKLGPGKGRDGSMSSLSGSMVGRGFWKLTSVSVSRLTGPFRAPVKPCTSSLTSVAPGAGTSWISGDVVR